MDIFLIVFGALFSVMNPFGTVPVFVGLTQEQTKKERKNIVFKTSPNILIILLFFDISINSLKIAGGLIIVSSGFVLLTGVKNYCQMRTTI